MNGFSYQYHLEESTFNFRGIRSDFNFSFTCSMKFLRKQNSPDVMPCSAASHLGLYCLPMSHKKDDRLIQLIGSYDFFSFQSHVHLQK